MRTILLPPLYFSFNQFMVFDSSVELPGCEWTERHSLQGFARRDSVVNFNSLLEFGEAQVAVSIGPCGTIRECQRAIAVPFIVSSGKVLVEGPEENDIDRGVELKPGYYRLICSQRVLDDEHEDIELVFEPRDGPLDGSQLLIRDDGLNPHFPLIETAHVAGEQ